MRSASGAARGAGAGRQRRDAGHDRNRAAVREPRIEIHEGAVEERIALAQHGHAPAGLRLGENLRRGRVIDIRLGKGAIAERHADGDLLLPAGQMAVDDGAREALALLRRRIGDDIGGADEAQRLQRQQFRIAGPDADAPDLR